MGNVIGNLIYDGKDSRDWGVIVGSINTHNAPQRVVEEVAIPGRNGTLTIDSGRFENIVISYKAMILSDFADKFDEFKAFLLSRVGYARLEDSFNPSFYRMAKVHDAFEPSVILFDAAGKFEIPFDCDPRRFLKSGEKVITFTVNGTIQNPTYFDAKPLLRVEGTGTITINSKVITITENQTYIYIDLESLNAYHETTNMNNKVSIEDGIVLKPGNNTINISGVTEVRVTPRWWTI